MVILVLRQSPLRLPETTGDPTRQPRSSGLGIIAFPTLAIFSTLSPLQSRLSLREQFTSEETGGINWDYAIESLYIVTN